jgi:hypothetical protein
MAKKKTSHKEEPVGHRLLRQYGYIKVDVPLPNWMKRKEK